jgi:hypothetical protein
MTGILQGQLPLMNVCLNSHKLDKEGNRIDSFGKKYLSALYMRASGPLRPSVPFRYVVWAFHSRKQADLLRASTQYWEQDRLTWTEAKRMGTPFWLSDIESLVSCRRNLVLPLSSVLTARYLIARAR